MITQIKILPSLPMTAEDYAISRQRMTLLTRLEYLAADRADSALMFALTDAKHEKQENLRCPYSR